MRDYKWRSLIAQHFVFPLPPCQTRRNVQIAAASCESGLSNLDRIAIPPRRLRPVKRALCVSPAYHALTRAAGSGCHERAA